MKSADGFAVKKIAKKKQMDFNNQTNRIIFSHRM